MKIKIITTLAIALLAGYSCLSRGNTEQDKGVSEANKTIFTSSDQALVQSFDWAKKMALSYAHDGSDPVGYWYEAALPSRSAFCMRDVSHQSIGAEVIGLSLHNENMLTKFVSNISDGKDWCSFWEINKDDLPAPVDYTDDDHFWYNLNANFDIMQASLKLYEWTGNEKYLQDPLFTNFYQKTLNEYIDRWQLKANQLMERPEYLNVKDVENNSHRSTRGLPSYVENYPHLTASSDLIASIYAGIIAYSKMADIKGNKEEQAKYEKEAEQYLDLLDSKWWNPETNSYHTFWTSERKFASGEGLTHVLWFDAIKDPKRIRATCKKILETKNWNAENKSHIPTLFYSLNYLSEAYEELIALRTMPRCEYPEVSYGVLEGIVSGTMGIAPMYSKKRIITLPKFTNVKENDWLEIKNLPTFGGYISVRHDNSKSSHFTNNTGVDLTWQASFMGEHTNITIDNKEHKAQVTTDRLGSKISHIDINVPVGKIMAASIK